MCDVLSALLSALTLLCVYSLAHSGENPVGPSTPMSGGAWTRSVGACYANPSAYSILNITEYKLN